MNSPDDRLTPRHAEGSQVRGRDSDGRPNASAGGRHFWNFWNFWNDPLASRWIVVFAIGLAFGLGVMFRGGHLNGFPSLTTWVWPWRNLGNLHTSRALFAPFAVVAWVLWKAEQGRSRPWILLGLLALSNFLLQVLGMMADPRGIRLVQQIVVSENATAYYTDALKIQNIFDWLKHFHEAILNGHSFTHPAGPILFYYAFVKALGPSASAFLGGLSVGLIASAGVWVMYKFAGLWTTDQRTRLLASAFYALLPALTVMFPEFDQAYPIFSMLLIWCWVRALDGTAQPLRQAMLGGVLLFAATFFAYNLLATGAFLAFYALYWLWTKDWTGPAWTFLFRTAGAVVVTCAALYLVLWIATGYNPPASFLRSLLIQEEIAATLNRRYATSIVYDLYDFSLGAGMLALPIVAFYVKDIFHLNDLGVQLKTDRRDIALTLIALATILTVDLSGLLRGETARVWIFLQPLWIVPVSLELARLRWPWTLSIFTLQWWILVCIKAKMTFVEP